MMRSVSKRPVSDQDGVALVTTLLAMLVLLMLGALFVAYAVPLQQQTAGAQAFESGLHVAESSAELAIASLADPSQPQQPFIATTAPPEDLDGARQWAIDQAQGRVDATCSNFQTTAGGDGVAIVDGEEGTVYGVGFLPSCQNPTTVRVMRVAYDMRPLTPMVGEVGILTGGDIYFDHSNAKIDDGGVHANGDIIGTPGTVEGPYSASGSCVSSDCTSGAAAKPIENFTARKFWEVRTDTGVNPTGDPFYELCPEGLIHVSDPDAEEPCTQDDADAVSLSNWSHAAGADGAVTWTWTSNAGPPPGQYYVYRGNLVNKMNNGNGNSSRASFFAEAHPDHVHGNDLRSGSVTFTSNPKFFPSWPGVGIIADVDVLILQNLRGDGEMTLVFAREQFRIDFNGNYDRIMFMSCDQALGATNYNEDDPECVSDGLKSSTGSPIDTTRITKNATFDNPLTGEAIVPNLGITGVADWEVL